MCESSTCQMTPLLSKMSIFCVRAGCEIQMATYTSKHASHSLSNKPFLRVQCTQTHNLKTSGHMWTFSISNNCYIIRDILCVVQICTRDPTGELWPETSIYIAIWYCSEVEGPMSLLTELYVILVIYRKVYLTSVLVVYLTFVPVVESSWLVCVQFI